MFKFSKCNAMSLFFLSSLSVSVFANAGFDEQTGLNDTSTTNLVELFKVKADASEYITNLEEKISVTELDEQEMILVEFAQALLYYQERHHSGSNENSTNAKELNSRKLIQNKALNAYKRASVLALDKNRIKYTRELSELTVSLGKKIELVRIFDDLLQHGGDEKGTYLAHVDYADGLAKFKDGAAETQFLSAITMRTPVDGVEANFRYANFLLDNGKLREALNVLDKFTIEERRRYIHIALSKQNIMHQLKIDTNEIDLEIKKLRKNLSGSPFISIATKFTSKHELLNILELPVAHAFTFSHNNEDDDTRKSAINSRVSWAGSFAGNYDIIFFLTSVVNVAEVVYNEARGAKALDRQSVGWVIRNRATINMNGCDFYPGSESDLNVSVCRALTPRGSLFGPSDMFKRYSCVVHGGTSSVGASHSAMNDSHVDIYELVSSGILWDILHLVSGWVPDPTGPYLFAPSVYPEEDMLSGNPSGAQEWSHNNYCPINHSCKVRLGNIDGSGFGAGYSCQDDRVDSSELLFWGRKYGNNLESN